MDVAAGAVVGLVGGGVGTSESENVSTEGGAEIDGRRIRGTGTFSTFFGTEDADGLLQETEAEVARHGRSNSAENFHDVTTNSAEIRDVLFAVGCGKLDEHFGERSRHVRVACPASLEEANSFENKADDSFTARSSNVINQKLFSHGIAIENHASECVQEQTHLSAEDGELSNELSRSDRENADHIVDGFVERAEIFLFNSGAGAAVHAIEVAEDFLRARRVPRKEREFATLDLAESFAVGAKFDESGSLALRIATDETNSKVVVSAVVGFSSRRNGDGVVAAIGRLKIDQQVESDVAEQFAIDAIDGDVETRATRTEGSDSGATEISVEFRSSDHAVGNWLRAEPDLFVSSHDGRTRSDGIIDFGTDFEEGTAIGRIIQGGNFIGVDTEAEIIIDSRTRDVDSRTLVTREFESDASRALTVSRVTTSNGNREEGRLPFEKIVAGSDNRDRVEWA